MERGIQGFRKGDLAAIICVVLLAGLVFMLFLPRTRGQAAYAEIYQDGRLIQTVSLTQERTFTVTGRCVNTIAVRDGKIAVIASDCPGEDCVGCGWIGSAGRSIVCLPNGLEIRVISENGDVDFVVG